MRNTGDAPGGFSRHNSGWFKTFLLRATHSSVDCFRFSERPPLLHCGRRPKTAYLQGLKRDLTEC